MLTYPYNKNMERVIVELSKLQLTILSTKLEDILSATQTKDNDFVNNIEFKEMLCLATNIDLISANKMYQGICKEADKTMSLNDLSEIIARHINSMSEEQKVVQTKPMHITDEQYAQIKHHLRDFWTYLYRLNKNKDYICNNPSIRDEIPEINIKEKELNKIVQSALHTKQEYDWLAFYNDNLPTRYGLNNFFNS